MIERAMFLLLSAITLLAAVGVVFARTVFVNALYLVLAFVGVAGMYVLLGAGFLGVIQILIYVGAISVLILFAVMLTRDVMAPEAQINANWVLASIVAMATFGVLAVVVYNADWPLEAGRVVPAGGAVVAEASLDAAADTPGLIEDADGNLRVPDPITMLGRAFMNEHLLAFEVVSIVLLVALVGAIVIARD